MGFGGTVPCAQTKGIEGQTFYFEGQHPEELLRNGNYDHMPILMGATTHEGSFVYGGRVNLHLSLEPIKLQHFRYSTSVAYYNLVFILQLFIMNSSFQITLAKTKTF